MDDIVPKARRTRRERGPTSPDPIDIAMAAEAGDAAAESPARVLLIKQARLIDAQRRSENFGAALKLLTGAAGLAVAVALGAMAVDASREDGMVIQSFSVPPELAARGLTGEVVASKLLDELNTLQAATDSLRAKSSYADTSTDKISVQIPNTGVSLGDIRRMLVDWLGHQTHIRGEVYTTTTLPPASPGAAPGGPGLVVAARSGGEPAVEHAGPAVELNKLIRAAAEDIYAKTQPYRYGVYLDTKTDRHEDARKLFANMVESGPASERAWAYHGLAMNTADDRERERLFRRALALNPDLSISWGNLAATLARLGDEEGSLRARRHALESMERPDHGGIRAEAVENRRHSAAAQIATVVGDHGLALEEAKAGYATSAEPAQRRTAERALRTTFSLLHDTAAARALIPRGQDDGAVLMAGMRDFHEGTDAPNADIAFALEHWQGCSTRTWPWRPSSPARIT